MRAFLYAAAVFLFLGSESFAQDQSGRARSWENSPLNWQNSSRHFDNSPLNWRNSPRRWENSPLNPNSNGLYDGHGNRQGYIVPRDNGQGFNAFSPDGRWLGYGKTTD